MHCFLKRLQFYKSLLHENDIKLTKNLLIDEMQMETANHNDVCYFLFVKETSANY